MMLSTNDTRIYCSGTTIAQDIIRPLLKEAPTPKQHLLLIKGCTIFVGIMFFGGSVLMKQPDYINLFITIVSSIWMGGCVPVMLGGLYCKYGDTTGAYCSSVSGMFITLNGMFTQRNWADMIHPRLERHDLTNAFGNVLNTISGPLIPIIVWEMNPKKFPINSVGIYALAMLISLTFYMIGFLLAYKGSFNMDKISHRGIYNEDREQKVPRVWKITTISKNLVGITHEYSKFDHFLAWFTFYYQFVFVFFFGFIAVVFWNAIAKWSDAAWSCYFLIFTLIVPGFLAFLCTFLFTIGGWHDLIQLFRDMKNRKEDNPEDNGMVKKIMIKEKSGNL